MDNRISELLKIQKVDKNTELMNLLLNFVENFSWTEVKEHTLSTIKNWEYKKWETPFAAMIDATAS